MSVAPAAFEFTSGGTLGGTARSYVTRCADSDLLNHLFGGEFCYVLTSRQMGKSSLMVRTADRLRQENKPCEPKIEWLGIPLSFLSFKRRNPRQNLGAFLMAHDIFISYS